MTRLITRGQAAPRAGGMTMARIDGGPRRRVLGTGPDRPVRADRRAARLVHRAFDGDAWSTVEDLGGTLASAPAVTAWAVDRMEVFAIFDDGQLWDRYWDGASWHPWESLGGELDPDRRLRRIVVGTGPARRLRQRAATAGSGTAGGTARAGSTGSGSDKSQAEPTRR